MRTIWVGIALVVTAAAAAGCTKDTGTNQAASRAAPAAGSAAATAPKPVSAPAPAPAPAPGPAAAPAVDPMGERIMDNAQDALKIAQRMAAQEHDDVTAKTQQLEQRIQDVEALVDGGELDRAEIKASAIQWQPDPTRSMISDTDAELIKQYDERRETLLRIIRRKRAAHP